MPQIETTFGIPTILSRCFTVLALTFLICGGVGAVNYTDYWYCNSVEDFLDCRPYYSNTSLVFEPRYLQWGRENGVPECQGEILPDKKTEALYGFYRLIRKKYLPDAVLAANAPDAGVNVTVGEPRVVMFAPEGKAADREANVAKLGHLGPTLAAEGRWGQYMFPQIDLMRNGMLVVTVMVGGDTPVGRNYLYYVSNDGGEHWTHYAYYDLGSERPATEIALRLPDGEELRGPNETDNKEIDVGGLNLKTYNGYYRLGDLPKEKQGVPIYSREPGVESWVRETAFWDANLLIPSRTGSYGQLPSPIAPRHTVTLKDGSLATSVFRMSVFADIGADGKFNPEGENHQVWRSSDRGRTWLQSGTIPRVSWFPFRPDLSTVRAHLLAFSNGNLVASYRHPGLYWSGGGPLIVTRSRDHGKTWSKPRAIRMPGVNPVGVVLKNGIAAIAYQRPGVFLTFCGDGKGERWGNDVTLVKAWRYQRDENSCCNSSLLATGPDRFMIAYTKWDVPDPWGQPRQAVIVQEFVVSKK